ncbi:MAG: hypothetical protein CVV06_06985 [Gammaproteobacteria bacterium HGW-Gammaproteobacteria-10]|nr:MAG: hypothetical protein CVV06_06985 [Gammaproteobacteria bacterium HGW-Gammaproteobacteria-10]
MIKQLSISLLLAGTIMTWSHNSSACNLTDVKFGVYDGASATQNNADACNGPSVGNDPWANPNTGLTNFNNEGGTWYSLAKWDHPGTYTNGSAVSVYANINTINTEIGKISFSLVGGTINGGYNTFTLNWTYAFDNLYLDYIPIQMDLNIVTKHSNGYAEYFFDDKILYATNGTSGYGEGSFQITYQCTGQNGGTCVSESPSTNFSHLSIYGRNLIATEQEDPVNPGGSMPEPSMVLLMGIGFLGFGATQLRKRHHR